MKRSLTRPLTLIVSLLLLCGLIVAGCNDFAPLGATVGGAQDIGHARNLIEAGGVPSAEYIVAEGLFAEHDIAPPEEECNDPLCLSLGYAYATVVDDESYDLFLHLGLTTSITRETFARPDLDLALVIDRSGSMRGGSMDAVKEALHSLVPKLTSGDNVTLIQFDNEVDVVMSLRRMDGEGKEELRDAIECLTPDGGTDIESGITKGYERLKEVTASEGRSRRVMLFTDARPNVGRTGPDSFREITSAYAEQGIGLTAFGVGIDFGQELLYHISRLRGGNFFFLRNQERIREVFNEEFDLLVTPIVHDLKVTIPNPPGATIKEIYGLPDQAPDATEVTLEIPTVFFSSNRGAIILRYSYESGEYAVETGERVGGGRISYTKVDQTAVDREKSVIHTAASVAPDENYFSGEGTRLGVALTNVYLGLHEACLLYQLNSVTEALEVLDRAITTATTENLELMNDGLAEEIELMKKLRENIAG